MIRFGLLLGLCAVLAYAAPSDFTDKMVQAVVHAPYDDNELWMFHNKRIVIYQKKEQRIAPFLNKGKDNAIFSAMNKNMGKQFYDMNDAVVRVPGSTDSVWIIHRPWFKDGAFKEPNCTVLKYTIPGGAWGNRKKHTFEPVQNLLDVFPGLAGTDFAAGVSDASDYPDNVENGHHRLIFFNRYTFGIYDLDEHKLEGEPQVLLYAYPKTRHTALANNSGIVTNTMSLTGGPDGVTLIPGTNKLMMFRNQFYHELDIESGDVTMLTTATAFPGLH